MIEINVQPYNLIQDSLNILNSNNGGTLNLNPVGTFTLTSDLTFYNNITINGNGAVIDFGSTAHQIKILGANSYSTGTITSISNGVNVVGSGTSWLANVVAGRDSFFINGQWMIIAVVTSDTTLVLAEGYDGATIQAGTAYKTATTIQNVGLQNLTIKNSTTSAISISNARFVNFVSLVTQSNNIGIDASYVTEFSINGLSSVLSTSHGVNILNGGRFNWSSVNAVGNGGSGIVYNSVRSAGFSQGVGNSNTLNGFTLTGCTDVTLNNFSAEFNGAKGVEGVSGNASCSFIDGGIRSSGSDGIKLTASSNKCQIIMNTLEYNGGWGINIANANCSTNILLGNIFTSNTGGAVSNSGTSTLIRSNQGVADN